jgi:alkylation response protein AidB-like acyl-CoA dehydrogenase
MPTGNPTPRIPTHAEILARAAAISERIEARAQDSERARRLDPDAIAAMTEAGIWRLLAPRCYGGYETTLGTQMESTAILAQAYPAAGWLQIVLGGHSWVLGSFPDRCQDEVFADGADVRIPGTLAAQGKAVTADGGFRLSGRWQFCSGVDHGDWLLIGSVADALPGSPDRGLHVVVPKAEVEVDDTWYSLGLRGTGSKDIVARDVFVPAHRTMSSRIMFEGRSPHAGRHATGLYRLPVLSGLALQLGGAALGIARGMLELHVERTRTRLEIYTKNAKAQSVGTQSRIAEAGAELVTAELLLRRAADGFDRIAARREPATVPERAELKWHAAYAVELCRRATERIFAASGAHAVYDDSRLQALFRDMNTACHHATVDFDGTAEMFGRMTLGLPPGTSLV